MLTLPLAPQSPFNTPEPSQPVHFGERRRVSRKRPSAHARGARRRHGHRQRLRRLQWQRLVAMGRNGEERGGNQGGKGKGSAFLSLRDINAAGAEKRSARKHCSNPAVTEIIQDMIQWAPPHLAVHRGRQDITARSPGTLTHRDGAS